MNVSVLEPAVLHKLKLLFAYNFYFKCLVVQKTTKERKKDWSNTGE